MMPYVKDDAGEIREQIEKEKGNEYRSNLFSQKREERLVFDEESRYDEKERTYVHEVETLRVNGVFPSNDDNRYSFEQVDAVDASFLYGRGR